MTFVGSEWSFVFFITASTANDLQLRRISIPDPIHYIYFLILILEKEPVFPFSMLSAKQGNYWYHFLVWRCPWLGIEPGTSHTRCQHSTTRLSRRRVTAIEYRSRLNLPLNPVISSTRFNPELQLCVCSQLCYSLIRGIKGLIKCMA